LLLFWTKSSLRRETRTKNVGHTRHVLREHEFPNLSRSHPPPTTAHGYPPSISESLVRSPLPLPTLMSCFAFTIWWTRIQKSPTLEIPISSSYFRARQKLSHSCMPQLCPHLCDKASRQYSNFLFATQASIEGHMQRGGNALRRRLPSWLSAPKPRRRHNLRHVNYSTVVPGGAGLHSPPSI
jgi:hypothetical protein